MVNVNMGLLKTFMSMSGLQEHKLLRVVSQIKSRFGVDLIDVGKEALSTGRVVLPAPLLAAIQPGMAPVTAKMVTGWLTQNDKDGEVFKLFDKLTHLPLPRVQGEFRNTEDFLENGLFPLINDFTDPRVGGNGIVPTSPCCGTTMNRFSDNIWYCPCGEKYEH